MEGNAGSGQIALIGVMVVWILREVFGFLRKKAEREDITCANCPQLTAELQALRQTLKPVTAQIHDMHDWHNKEDDDGVKVWYVRRSLETAINKLADNINMQTSAFKELMTSRGEDSKRLESIQNVVGQIRDANHRNNQ